MKKFLKKARLNRTQIIEVLDHVANAFVGIYPVSQAWQESKDLLNKIKVGAEVTKKKVKKIKINWEEK